MRKRIFGICMAMALAFFLIINVVSICQVLKNETNKAAISQMEEESSSQTNNKVKVVLQDPEEHEEKHDITTDTSETEKSSQLEDIIDQLMTE